MRFRGAHLQQTRRLAGLSQTELSLRAGVGLQVVTRAEQGRSTPSAEACARLARALEISIESLFEDGAVPAVPA